ncbi:MAG: gluconate 2-dehydrogenase subunit 3 family protein [Saprospiraceae bacterium]|nr:gluconate 2-dehydrogenase subunit 3 family protein [Saprospiraceae bacterium]MCB9320131.1 gluconate 2-dehydrogenase subunit 3 family protein [Lewinellaceae bacterium]
MHRRTAIQSLGLITTSTLFSGVLAGFISSCAQPSSPDLQAEFFSADELDLVRQLVDVILPETKTASASMVNTHLFIDQVCAKVMTSDQQQVFREGLTGIKETFVKAEDKTSYLTTLDRKAFEGDEDSAWFRTLKQLALIGFFTSQEGTTKASNYVKIPEAYKGEIPADDRTLNYGKTSLHFNV